MNIKRVLVSQPTPASIEKSPYATLIDKYKLELDFEPFIKTVDVPVREFRKQRIDVAAHTAVIFTSRNSVDNYFRICKECRFDVPETMMYFCVSEAVALYLQKYTTYRKRKIFFGQSSFIDLMDLIIKHSSHKFIVPLPSSHKPEIPKILTEAKIKHSIAILSTTEVIDLKDKVDISKYDMLLFYSPSEILSLKQNFEDKISDIKIAAFGTNTAQAVADAGYNLVALAPTVESPSMVMAVAKYVNEIRAKKDIDTNYIKESIELANTKNQEVIAKVKNIKPKRRSAVKKK